MAKEQRESEFRLDPKDYPKQIDLELSDEVLEGLQEIAERSGRSVSEVMTDIISRGINE